jgi:hypothetical protein
MGWLHLTGDILETMHQTVAVGAVTSVTAQEMLEFLHNATGLTALRPVFQKRWTRYCSLVQRLKRVLDRLSAREEYLTAGELALRKALLFMFGHDAPPLRNTADAAALPSRTHDILYVDSMSSIMDTFADLM